MSFRRSLFVSSLVVGCAGTPAGAPDAFVAPDAVTPTDAFVPIDAWAAPSTQPPVSAGPHAATGSAVTFAITKLYLGNTDRSGAASPDAWRAFGYDLDHRSTNDGVCMPVGNGAPEPDGVDGTDNAFGHRILPILEGIDSTVVTHVNDEIAQGQPTHLLTIDALGTDADYDPLGGRAYGTLDLGMTPRFDGTDTYGVDPTSLATPSDLTMALVSFDHAYLVGNVLVAHATGDLPLRIEGTDWPIHEPTITITLDATHTHGANGTIAGVIRTDDATAAMRTVAGRADPSLCTGATIDSILMQMQQASDILTDRSQDATMPCDAISVGIGFDAVVVQLGAIGAAPTPDPNPCP